ncbi:SPOR domain-containing protein [Ignatzschineria sp. LJL83]
MSNSQSNPILQRIVGGVFLLALILLVAILLLQPSDTQMSNVDNSSSRPTTSLPNTSKPQDNSNNRAPMLVLDSTTIQEEENGTELLPNDIEIVGDDLWQQVEEKTSETIVPAKPILIAGTETPNPIQERPTTSQKPQTTPKPKAETPKPSTPKLELIANSEKPATSSNNNVSGQWYVQIGAFGNLANAQKLVSEYQKQGYSVRIQKDKNLNRVQIGPFSTQKAAEQVKAKTKTPSTNPAVIHFP